jgi:hypothetical protein
MKIKTSELAAAALDWAVCKAGGGAKDVRNFIAAYADYGMYHYSTDWAHGGPIIEMEGIELLCNLTTTEAARFEDSHADWQAFYRSDRTTAGRQYATTPLIAAMRCYVASKLGDEVDIPEKLCR